MSGMDSLEPSSSSCQPDTSTGAIESSESESTSSSLNGTMTDARQLTEEELNRLANQDTQLVSKFHREKLEREAMRNWDKFYKRNETRFFKDRRWTSKEFGDILGGDALEGCQTTTLEQSFKPILLEVGCGVGNFMLPLLEDPNCRFYCIGCDFSPRAIDLVKSSPLYDESRCKAFVADATESPNQLKAGLGGDVSVDIASLIFVLSAIHPDKMTNVLANIYEVLKPGGLLIFRDYGLYDHAQIRFAVGSKISDNFYVRQDGTRAYYFSIDHLTNLCTSVGFEVISCNYVHRETVNRKEGVSFARIFVQAKLRKPRT